MKKTAMLKTIVAALIIVLSLQVFVFAEEQPQLLISPPAEQPAAWAVEAVQWSSIYGLASDEMFAKYSSKVTQEELHKVCVNLYEKLTGKTATPEEEKIFTDNSKLTTQKEATRLEMVTSVYNVLKAAQPEFDFSADVNLTFKDIGSLSEETLNIVKYSVAKGILHGRNKEILDLESQCTRQELLVFVKNAYEFAIYESGRYSKGAFWKVSDENNTVYLLGSIHIADATLYPLSKEILNAYEKSDVLVVEADISKQEEAANYMAQRAMYADENTLEKNVPEELYKKFVEFVTPYGIQEEVYSKLKPWYAALLVQNLQLMDNSYSGSLGVDMYFLSKAMGQKDILEIEGIKFQVDMFDSFSNELQCQFLASALGTGEGNENTEASVELVAYMLKCWKEGNTEELARIVKADVEAEGEFKEFNEKMWSSRDNNMVQKVREYLADPENKTYFVVVGAGHMVGSTGIVTQLEDEYKVEQIK